MRKKAEFCSFGYPLLYTSFATTCAVVSRSKMGVVAYGEVEGRDAKVCNLFTAGDELGIAQHLVGTDLRAGGTDDVLH